MARKTLPQGNDKKEIVFQQSSTLKLVDVIEGCPAEFIVVAISKEQ